MGKFVSRIPSPATCNDSVETITNAFSTDSETATSSICNFDMKTFKLGCGSGSWKRWKQSTFGSGPFSVEAKIRIYFPLPLPHRLFDLKVTGRKRFVHLADVDQTVKLHYKSCFEFVCLLYSIIS